ncbi:forkhead-associated domain-containing protein 1 isoform X4 [Macrotis lagotis]|uniref:forkhead-associated domain-containing protein 1 isoform X4 n=1 Tax=Macrotis lagotis TaxID=92651 RepID=UPI003D6966CD
MESGVHRTAARGDPGWSPASEPEQRPPARLPSSSLRRAGRLLQPRRTAIMKAFLKCSEGFIFLRRYTTIGRHENSDIVLKYPDIDNHHALIEFNEEEGTFILQDFNSLSGTFVNNCHIQNVAVKLKPGDVLRFGSGGLTYELVVEFLTSGRYSSWSRTVNADQIPSFSTQLPVLYHQPISAHRSWSQGLMEGTQPRPPVEKRPISASGRKMLTVSSDPIDKFPVKQVWTAGDSIWSPDEVFCNLDQHSIMPHKKGQVMHLNQSHLFNLPHLEQSHFINISHLDRSHRPSFPQVEQTQLVTIANELNTQDDIIQHLEQEVNRLSSFEMESKHKDAVIANLQNEVATMSQKLMLTQTTPKQSHVKMGQKNQGVLAQMEQSQLVHKQQPMQPQLVSSPREVRTQEDIIQQVEQETNGPLICKMESQHKDAIMANLQNEVTDISQKLMSSQTAPNQTKGEMFQELKVFKWDVDDQESEILPLKEQINKLQKGCSDVLHQTLNERNKEIANLKVEGENFKKEKARNSVLMTSLKKDIELKDSMALKLRQEVDRLKSENQEKNYQLSAITSRCAQLKEDLKKDELEAKEKELKSCKSQIKDLEQQMKTLGEQLQKSFNEHNLISKMLREKSKAEEKLQADSRKKFIQLQEMGYREKLIKDNLDKAVYQLEHFRNQIIEAIYGRGKLPQSRIVTNQQLVETVSHVIEDNFHLQQKKIIMNKNHSINATKDEFLVQMDKLKAFLEDCQTCLKLSCCGNDLRKQLGDFQNFPVDASVKWLHKIIVEILQMVVCWVEKFEQLLKDVGIELAHSDKGLSLYLSKFLENHKKIANRNQELQTKLSNLQEIHHSLVQKLQGQALEHERQIKEQIKLMQEKQEEENRVWKNSLTQEKIQAKAAVEEEKKKVQDLENHLRKLKKEMESKSQEESQQTNTKDQKDKESLTLSLNKALEELSEARKKQILLGEQLLKHQDTLKAVQEEKNLEKRILEMEIVQYKEQVKQHSQTIVALEERLQQVTQQNKDIEQKIVSLKENIPGTSSYWRKNTSEKVQKELQKGPLRKTLATGKSHDPLLEEFMVVQKQLISQHELTNNLKTDLSKSQTKISTLKKEFDEQRKAEVGQKLLIQQQKKELKEVKEKLIQMSNLTDQKNKEIESLKAQQRSSTPVETKKVCTMCDVEIQVDNDPDVFIFNQEASSFIELGTKCKGHRHEEVIQRQKNALAELRGQIKELSPNVRDAGMESLLESKKSKLGKSIRIIEKESTLPNIDLKVGNKPIQSLFPSRLFNTPAERAAKLDLIEALDLSEKLYMDLTKTLSSLMSIKDMPGNLSMKHLSQKEREKINQLRRKDLDLVFVKISQLKNRLERKEDLLREYEKDNESLRQSKIPMQVYQAQMGKLEDEIYKEVEEKALLKEALERTENQLNLERKMNRSIKQQKERFDEQEQKNSKEIPISNCLQKDRHERLKAKKITLKTDQERNLQNKELPSKAIL